MDTINSWSTGVTHKNSGYADTRGTRGAIPAPLPSATHSVALSPGSSEELYTRCVWRLNAVREGQRRCISGRQVFHVIVSYFGGHSDIESPNSHCSLHEPRHSRHGIRAFLISSPTIPQGQAVSSNQVRATAAALLCGLPNGDGNSAQPPALICLHFSKDPCRRTGGSPPGAFMVLQGVQPGRRTRASAALGCIPIPPRMRILTKPTAAPAEGVHPHAAHTHTLIPPSTHGAHPSPRQNRSPPTGQGAGSVQCHGYILVIRLNVSSGSVFIKKRESRSIW